MTNLKINKDYIIYKLINKANNTELLESIPYVDYLDMAIIFYQVVEGFNDGEGTCALITNKHLEDSDILLKDLMLCASENTPRLLGLKINGILSSIAEYSGDDTLVEALEEELGVDADMFPLYVATNKVASNGAAVILYKDMLKAMAAKLKSDLYVIPCSIHEVILVKVMKNCQMNTEEIRKLIAEVNRTELRFSDILSDSLYYYSRETGVLSYA
ncbi:MAG: hypothetical protein IKP29_08130 [Pseudobutyrivibrio sp.]|nr:hypothetical protein [Pseudobutyrivibrio sp.]